MGQLLAAADGAQISVDFTSAWRSSVKNHNLNSQSNRIYSQVQKLWGPNAKALQLYPTWSMSAPNTSSVSLIIFGTKFSGIPQFGE